MSSNAEELGLAARAYYNNSSRELQNYAKQFFKSMDANRDGRISFGEFSVFLRQNGYTWVDPSMFAQLDANNDGSLDFWEVMTFYYIIKTRGLWCDACSAQLPGLYFTCVACFDCGQNTYDLCAKCYSARRFRHSHNSFLDSYLLLRSKRGIAPGMNVSQAVTRPQTTIQARGTSSCPWTRSDRDGRVSLAEFAHFIQCNGYGWVDPRGVFAQLDSNRDGGLDFWEVLTFYYIVKTRGVWCRECRAQLHALYFTCVDCFDSGRAPFDLCSDCYAARSFRHEHRGRFLDSFVLLRSKIGVSPGTTDVTKAIARPQQNGCTGLVGNYAFMALEVAIAVGNIAGVIAACTIM